MENAPFSNAGSHHPNSLFAVPKSVHVAQFDIEINRLNLAIIFDLCNKNTKFINTSTTSRRGIMDTEKTVNNNSEEISRRACLAVALALFGLVNTSTSALASTLSSGRKTIVIDDDYVLVDGWLLRAGELTQ